MELESALQLEHILGHASIGIALLDTATLRIRYINHSLKSLLDEPWSYQEITGTHVSDVLPPDIVPHALPLFKQVAATMQRVQYNRLPYEGFLESRGRTYWRVSIEYVPASFLPANHETATPSLLITVEDITDSVRSQLHLSAIHHISSVLAGPTALPQVLTRILQALHDMVGSKRCAVLLRDQTNGDEMARSMHIAAHRGLHPTAFEWHPTEQEHTLLGKLIARERQGNHAIIITDTSLTPDLLLPPIDDRGKPTRPGSVLCVPIFEPSQGDTILGSIEVYHRRTRGFPAEEVRLLERFAQQAGLAIHNARLFRSIERWARMASRSANQKENVMSAIPDGVVIYDPRWRIAEANPAARQLFGWTDDVIGLPITEALTRSTSRFTIEGLDQPDFIAQLEQRALAHQSDEIKLTNAAGQDYTLRCSYTPIRDEPGDIFAFITIYHDISQEAAARERVEEEVRQRTAELAQRNRALKKARSELKSANERMQVLLAHLPSGVIVVGAADHTINLINNRGIELLRKMGTPLGPHTDPARARKKVIGLSVEQVFRSLQMYNASGEFVPFEQRPMYRALFDGEACEDELYMHTPDGRTMHMLVNAAPFFDSDGAITDAVVVLHDISRTKALERAREDFFNTIAHELKTPLANIRAHLTALLARDLQWSLEEQYRFLQTADEQVERLVRMVNQLLDASRVEAGALRLDVEPILLAEMIEDLQERLEALIATSQRGLRVSLPPHLPAVQGDYELIMSVLMNLLSNAFRYAPEGDNVYLKVEPITEPGSTTPHAVTLHVIDHGPGIAAEQLKTLFSRFSTSLYSGEQARRGGYRWSPGTGLGLYISQGILEAHQSRLHVESSPGQGAHFSFTLPVYNGQHN
ncbi:PAS domain S-box-containing protein [Thermosporothrix hazakensis]|jgi:PAS domain S-box-containing protein|uniref:histidine kinase n=1 Tax=Thermosporothrix hazakensis TaxID=644383 RepID=A0A326UAT7_THEHA|nr:ATP-binding protein [Thermosporothrix hazakensis]PZW24888.1 PAS domain S-box-containing protein [Thermosporothrix hazakensis]GCE46423.1 hypothetical protein KTH_12920 [Thermosporothrix hazakensis]